MRVLLLALLLTPALALAQTLTPEASGGAPASVVLLSAPPDARGAEASGGAVAAPAPSPEARAEMEAAG